MHETNSTSAATDVGEFMTDLDGGQFEHMLSVALSQTAVRRVTIEAMSRSESTQEQLSASRSAFDQVKAASGDKPLPSHITVQLTPYQEFIGREISLRVSVLTGQKEPQFKLRIVKAAELADKLALELAERVGAVINEPCVLGVYSAKA